MTILAEPADAPRLRRLNPAFALVAACCRWPDRPDKRAAVVRAAAGVDWDLVVRIAHRHRVGALVSRALFEAGIAVPSAYRSILSADAFRTASRGHRLATETGLLTDRATRAGVAIVVLKGAALAQLAYGTLAMKQAIDIDLLVRAQDLPAMRRILSASGYHPQAQIVDKDEPWTDAEGSVLVELHSRLIDDAGMLDIDPFAHLQWVDIGLPTRLPTLETGPLFAYLCAHGAMHGWSRFKWLADVAALLGHFTPREITRLYHEAEKVGVGAAAGQTLLLCADLLATPVEAPLRRSLHRRVRIRLIVAAAYRSFTGVNQTTERDARALGTVAIHVSQFLHVRDMRAFVRLLVYKFRPRDDAGWATPIRWLVARVRQSRDFPDG